MKKISKNLKNFLFTLLLGVIFGLIAYPQALFFWPWGKGKLEEAKINLGLDLQGGIHLEYKADLSQLESSKADEAMQAVQDVIERRINAFGVAEPVIYTTKVAGENRLVVELPGVKDISEAKNLIKETPFLEFKEEGEEKSADKIPQNVLDDMNAKAQEKALGILERAKKGEDFATLARENSEDPGSKDNGGEYDFVKKGQFVPEYEKAVFEIKDGEIYPTLVETQFGWHIIRRLEVRGEGDNQEFKSAHILFAKKSQPVPQKTWVATGLTGKNLKNATVDFQNQGLSEPQVALKFDDEGARLFAEITKKNIGKQVAIFLDSEVISAPTVQAEITTGEAVITGNFSIEEAKQLVRRMNEGALPVPIELVSQQSVEASLGQEALTASVKAGAVGLLVVIIFVIFFYRFLGAVSAISLLIYTALMISIFKLSGFSPWPITFTLSGIAGFILSIGMAIDANILIFERTKEEIRNGRSLKSAVEEGFKRAWPSIRDGNYSTILTSLILVGVGTGFVKGFAIILIIGVLVSMFTAIVLTKNLLRFILGDWLEKRMWLIGRFKK
ncbi:MAG: protein translocase subunit SecD [Patescibacteria group bacterium]